ncbi:MAG TPA: MBL fold metallo-hydrolase [Longimicrobium sp.]|jgi:glyoxylase-like metal-dependent hydrolase (beta-lactamase superfamily II)|nr:MBL fold metallo-hydrolase [Longimicrobium sp.]
MMDALRTVLAPNSGPMTLDGTRTFIVGCERPAVIDPGPSAGGHLDAILAALEGRTPVAILLTHAHGDHAELAEPLAVRTGAPVMIAPGAAHPEDDERVAWRWLEDGDAIHTDVGTLQVVATPGHAPDHVAFHWHDRGAVFVGDLFMGEGDTTLVAPPEGDLAAYLRSLDRVASLSPTVLYPAHGPPLADPAEAVARYRRHRETRIEQVVQALRRAGPSRPRELLDAVYGADLHPSLRGAAEGSLHAILGYLSAEGMAEALPDGRHSLAGYR